jgi:hypothetical protein
MSCYEESHYQKPVGNTGATCWLKLTGQFAVVWTTIRLYIAVVSFIPAHARKLSLPPSVSSARRAGALDRDRSATGSFISDRVDLQGSRTDPGTQMACLLGKFPLGRQSRNVPIS